MRFSLYSLIIAVTEMVMLENAKQSLSSVKNNPSSLSREEKKEKGAEQQGRETAGGFVLIKYYHSASFHAGSVMKYSALRNPYSTSCYGILSDLFWGDILAASRCTSRVHREETRCCFALTIRRTGNYQYFALNHSHAFKLQNYIDKFNNIYYLYCIVTLLLIKLLYFNNTFQ